MNRLYASPLRVYLFLGILALIGIYCGFKLPVSLYPNSSKPKIAVNGSYGSLNAEEFLRTYGTDLEGRLRKISSGNLEVERVEADYSAGGAHYEVEFKWGAAADEALRETQTVVNSFTARLPTEIRESFGVSTWRENAGFFAMSFFSSERSIDELHRLLDPILTPRIIKVNDAEAPLLWNPSKQEVRVELNPSSMATLQLFPRDVEAALLNALGGKGAGQVSVGTDMVQIEMPRNVNDLDGISRVPVVTPSGKAVHLGDVATIDIGPVSEGQQVFKTDGTASLILFASPKPDGNVKKMSEELLQIVEELKPQFPPDVKYRVLVDPSEFIRSAVNNVLHEVLIAAGLAVLVLFFFIGSLRNVITAAIEIPLSMVLAFIMMRIVGMNMNLISLGGLALSAGMNVDASVVVMENIFRHFEKHPGKLDFNQRLQILTTAVNEVKFPIVASTIASLVVFIPLAFTSELTFAILGDLALAVVFSHGFSMFVALILVPTIRLHLMGKEGATISHSRFEPGIKRLENFYATCLGRFLARPAIKWGSYVGAFATLALLILFVLPRLPKEIVGIPDTDWMVLSVNTDGNTRTRQMEMDADLADRDLRLLLGDRVRYTFSQIHGANKGVILARLADKSQMHTIWKEMEKRFHDTPTINYRVGPWNPSELPIPDPPHMLLSVRGGTPLSRSEVSDKLRNDIREKKFYPRVYTQPNTQPKRMLQLDPNLNQWIELKNRGATFSTGDLSDILRVATTGRRIGSFPDERNENIDVYLRYPRTFITSPEDVAAFPIAVGPKLIPLKALVDVGLKKAPPEIYREDGRDIVFVKAKLDHEHEKDKSKVLATVLPFVKQWDKERLSLAKANDTPPTLTIEDADEELNKAISQLLTAVSLSVLLIFITMTLQFGGMVEALLVLVAIPLGLIGVIIALFVFKSTLSLNSALGVILLNGIAVANSIILVDFIKSLVESGMTPREAAVEAARARLRPILMTSLTTLLGMLPIALGTGEGGRILQPLGIAVAGGLWISMLLTLFLVPGLQVSYLEWRLKRKQEAASAVWVKVVLALSLLFPAMHSIAAETPAAESRLSFSEAMNAIVERSTSVLAAKAQLESVRASNLSSHLVMLPTISLTASQDYSRDSTAGASTLDRRGFAGTSRLNIFKFGADAAAMRAANREEETQEFLLADATLKSESAAVAALVALIQSELEMLNLEQSLQIRTEALRIAEARFKRGLTPQQEVDKLQVELNNATANFHDVEASLASARADLTNLLGHDRVSFEWPWKTALEKSKPMVLTLAQESLSQRPDWQAAEVKVEGARGRADEAFGKFLPSLDANFTYGFFQTRLGSSSRSGGEWSGGVTLTIPLFDRLDNYGSYRSLYFTRAGTEADLERIRRLANAEWQAARQALEIVRSSALERDKSLTLSRQLYKSGEFRFKRGLMTADELGRDQDRLYNSELLSIRGWAATHSQYARLCHALGRRIQTCEVKAP